MRRGATCDPSLRVKFECRTRILFSTARWCRRDFPARNIFDLRLWPKTLSDFGFGEPALWAFRNGTQPWPKRTDNGHSGKLCQVAPKRTGKTAKSKRVFGQPQAPPKMFRAGQYARISTHDQRILPLQIRSTPGVFLSTAAVLLVQSKLS